MKLWYVFRKGMYNYDEYDAVVVAAENEDEAQRTDPCGHIMENETDVCMGWAPPSKVKVEYIGEAKEGTEKGVILASFNAG